MTTKQITTIAKLLEVRDSMKAVHREDWSEHMETYGAIISALMDKSGVDNHVAAAITLSQDAANEGHPMIALLFLAVGVELSEHNRRDAARAGLHGGRRSRSATRSLSD